VIRCQFVSGAGWTSRAIEWFSAGGFSHVDIVLPTGELLGARSDVIKRIAPGVQIRPPFYEKWKKRVVMQLVVEPAVERKFLDFALKQRFLPYDHTAIWGFAAGRDWREPDSWFCSELVAASLEQSGAVPVLYSPANKIMPAGLATVLSAVGAVTA
jgi:hypothetical protein